MEYATNGTETTNAHWPQSPPGGKAQKGSKGTSPESENATSDWAAKPVAGEKKTTTKKAATHADINAKKTSGWSENQAGAQAAAAAKKIRSF